MSFRVISLFLISLSFIGQITIAKEIIKKESRADVPITYIINGTFDVSQNHYWFDQKDFFQNHKTLWKRVRNPFEQIEQEGGYEVFFKDEFLSSRIIPNLLLHTLGGAYDGRWLKEFFVQHEYSKPFLWAILTSYIARWGNEVLEVSYDEITSHDHIADLFIFDSLGLWLSTNEKWMRFLSKDLQMQAWHSIPFYDFEKNDFKNAGLNYLIRPKIFEIGGKTTPFFYFGMQNIIGLSHQLAEQTISIGSGIFLTDPLKKKSKLVTGLFYELNNGPAFSAFINGSEGYRWRVNLYPNINKLFERYQASILMGEKNIAGNYEYKFGLNINLPFGLIFRL